MLLSVTTGSVTARSPSLPTLRGRPLKGPQGLPGCVGTAVGLGHLFVLWCMMASSGGRPDA